MNRELWLVAGGFALQVAGPVDCHFRAIEIADVGRQKKNPAGNVLATLKAPSVKVMRNALVLVSVLEWGRAWEGEAPLDVNSWYRDAAYNVAIGSKAPRSAHITGCACDHNKRGWTPLQLALAYHHHHPNRDKLGIGYYAPNPRKRTVGFVHLDVRGLMPAVVRDRLGAYPARWSPTEPGWHHG